MPKKGKKLQLQILNIMIISEPKANKTTRIRILCTT